MKWRFKTGEMVEWKNFKGEDEVIVGIASSGYRLRRRDPYDITSGSLIPFVGLLSFVFFPIYDHKKRWVPFTLLIRLYRLWLWRDFCKRLRPLSPWCGCKLRSRLRTSFISFGNRASSTASLYLKTVDHFRSLSRDPSFNFQLNAFTLSYECA